jgi:hypothetical protein
MNPSTSLRNFTPSSSALPSPVSAIAGAADAGSQMLHGHPSDVVVKLQVTSAANALPRRSVTRAPACPPRARAVYLPPAVSGAVGVSVAVNVATS